MSGPHQQQCRIVHLLITLLTLLSLFHTASALEVTPSSPCSNFCIDRSSADPSDALSSATFTKDLSCLDSDYNGDNSTAIGRKFRTCVACEQTSGARAKGLEGEGNENDVYWFLFNLKSTVAWCVNGFFQTQQNPNTTLANSLCASSCGLISTAINDRLLETNETLQYNYCDSDNGAFLIGVDTCADCLNSHDNLKLLGNFLSALKSACTSKPSPGKTLSLPTNVFDLSTPTSTPVASTLPTPTASPPSAGLSTSVIAGITIATVAGVAILAAIIFFIIRGRKRRVSGMGPTGYELDGQSGERGADVKYYQQKTAAPPREMDAGSAAVELPASVRRGGIL